MTPILIICAIIGMISLYDFFNTRSWQQVTSAVRNEAVFEKRNKRYGAFQIRRSYNRNLVIILFGLLGGVTLISATTLSATKPVKEAIVIPETEITPITPVDKIEEPKPEPAAPAPPVSMQRVVAPVVSDDPQTSVATIDPVNPGPIDIIAPAGPGFIPTPPGPIGPGVDPGVLPVETPTDDPEIPDVPAEFPGGMNQFKPYLGANIVYPQIALEEGRGGKVFLRFIVDKDGEVSNVTIIRKTADCPECDAEAKRVIGRMPKWKPGLKKGKPVKSYFNIPVVFTPM